MRPLRRMLVVANTDWFIANYMLDFLRAHVRAGVEVIAGCPSGLYTEAIGRAGARWRELPISRGRGSLRSNLAAARAMARLERDLSPDLIHHVTAKPIILGALARSTRAGTLVIHALPGLGAAFSERGAWFDRLALLAGLRIAARMRVSRMVFQNPSDLGRVLGRGKIAGRVGRLIPGWGVSMERFSRAPARSDPPLVLMVSRMLWTKGVSDFVEAAALSTAGTRIRFALVGEPDPGNPNQIPRQTLQAWGQDGPVEWWGGRSDIPDLLSRAAVVALPSRYGEGVPQSLVEASAAGVPIVASDIPGCREVVEHGVNGFLVPPGDVRALARAFDRIVEDPGLQARMGESGRELARRRFATERVLAQYADLYAELGLKMDVTLTDRQAFPEPPSGSGDEAR